jgi:hypothetical protein
MAFARSAGQAFFPLDDELALLPGHLTPQVHAWLVRLAAWMPFAAASALLLDLVRVPVSPATTRRLTQTAGSLLVAAQTSHAADLLSACRLPQPSSATLLLSADGAMVPLVAGEWAEVKTLVIGEVPPAGVADGAARPTQALSYFSRLCDATTFGTLALPELHRRQVSSAAQVVAVTDGAEWLQGFVDLHRSDAVRILDFPHAAQRIGAIADTLWHDQPSTAQDWCSTQLHELKEHGPTLVLARLRKLLAGHREHPELNEHVSYLQKRVEQMRYPAYVAAGWPIGSGVVESANKLVVQARLKGAGMHWARANVNPMLALRNAVCNQRWEEAREQMHADQRRHVRKQQRQRSHLRHPLPPVPPLLLPPHDPPIPPLQPGHPWRPANSHPWRRAFKPAAALAKQRTPAAKL